jgi:hypothetical protein
MGYEEARMSLTTRLDEAAMEAFGSFGRPSVTRQQSTTKADIELGAHFPLRCDQHYGRLN